LLSQCTGSMRMWVYYKLKSPSVNHLISTYPFTLWLVMDPQQVNINKIKTSCMISLCSYFCIHTGDDYRCSTCNRTLINGTRSVIFSINIVDDNIFELDEEFVLTNITTLIPSSSSIRVITGSPEQTTVIITDNDCKLLNI